MKTDKIFTVKGPVIILSLITVLSLLLNGCYKDKAEKLYPGGAACDTLNMKYSSNVVPILSPNCATSSCHTSANKANAGNYAFDSHNESMVAVNNGKLMASIRHANGVSAMPKGAAKLSDCDINKIGAWINQGAKDN